ncbi:MAG TPA: class I SAM-dependent methyltransferase [Ignavibacteriaceae bacterium]|nr:class I SAM-dependent methyltransferase [Ignavibacteriaceae bacterium]
MNDKIHWYDGIFYDRIIAPNQDKMFSIIKNLIHDDSSVIDVGCGTGRLCFQLADKCSKVTGVDLSSKNISVANNILSGQNFSNVNFIHTDASALTKQLEGKFDYSIITYAIHEMPPEERVAVINQLKLLSDKIIIGEYAVQKKSKMWNIVNELVEFSAGKDHYKNYKLFLRSGGVNSLVKQCGLKIISEVINEPITSHIVLASL